MEHDQVPGLSNNMQTLLSKKHGLPKNTDGEIISNPSDCEEEMEACLPPDETINNEFKIARCEKGKGKALLQEKKEKEEEKKKEEDKRHFLYYIQLFKEITKEEEDKKQKEEEEIKKRKEEEGKKKELEEEKKQKHLIPYKKLYKDIMNGDWETTKRAFDKDSSAITGPVNYFQDTALHIAVRRGLSIQFINNLVELMSETDLETLDVNKDTALHCAGIVGYTEAARILVAKNPSLTKIRGLHKKTPLEWAAQYAHRDTVWLLLPVTRHEDPSVLAGESGANILNYLIIAEFYDIAIYLLQCYPDLAIQEDGDGYIPLHQLALNPHAFLSGSQLNFLQRLLYKCISVEKVNVHRKEDVENPAPPHDPRELRRKFKFLQNIHDTKLKHMQALQLTKMLCAEIVKTKTYKDRTFAKPIIEGAKLGIHELVWEIVKAYPDAMWHWDANQRRVFHLAVLNRKEKVYNLVYQMSLQKHYMMSYEDKFGNNILHLAGMLGPSDRISGAALQVQRELQWFKEVETIVQPSYRVQKNDDKKTPMEVFTEEHKDLVKTGEEWMKNTATSCTVVAALVITVVFAAAFTFPGGNNSDGYPIFLNQASFLIFSVSNALALFASSTSVLMFLGILTSRYSEEDFLKALPMRLCIGLATLFLSIAFMLAAFSSALHIALVHQISWVAAPIIVMACIPLTLFVFLQFPLLFAMISSTFGPSIFCKQGNEIFF